jgi:hypothetical protein
VLLLLDTAKESIIAVNIYLSSYYCKMKSVYIHVDISSLGIQQNQHTQGTFSRLNHLVCEPRQITESMDSVDMIWKLISTSAISDY